VPAALRSSNTCSKTRGTPSDRLLALKATAATMYHGFLRTRCVSSECSEFLPQYLPGDPEPACMARGPPSGNRDFSLLRKLDVI